MDRTALRSAESKVRSGLRQSDRNRLMRTRMSGGVGAGRSILPATRFGGFISVTGEYYHLQS
jgi:hypothetical protein